MENCYRHSDRPGFYYCQKDGNRMCDECACCHSPRIYCQYRSACIIDILTKEGEISPCGENNEEKLEKDDGKMSA